KRVLRGEKAGARFDTVRVCSAYHVEHPCLLVSVVFCPGCSNLLSILEALEIDIPFGNSLMRIAVVFDLVRRQEIIRRLQPGLGSVDVLHRPVGFLGSADIDYISGLGSSGLRRAHWFIDVRTRLNWRRRRG